MFLAALQLGVSSFGGPRLPALAGVNAAVVGILGAALYDPVWTTGVKSGADVAIALAGVLRLERWRTPPIVVVILCTALSLLAALILSRTAP